MPLDRETKQIALSELDGWACDTPELSIINGSSGSYEPDVSTHPLITYVSYEEARQVFVRALCGGVSKPALITLSNGVGPYGSCAPRSVANSENPSEIADRIILRRNHVGTLLENLSALARNVIQLKMYEDGVGNPARPAYVNAELCRRMNAAGLPTFAIDKRDGTKIYGKSGESLHHEIQPDGLFARVCSELIARRNIVLYLDHAFSEAEGDEIAARVRAKKAESKTRFVCGKSREEALADQTKLASEHYRQKIWGHGKTNVRCGFCLSAMTPG